MKQYQKAQMIAKNLPTGSYAAGCPVNERGSANHPRGGCVKCERTL